MDTLLNLFNERNPNGNGLWKHEQLRAVMKNLDVFSEWNDADFNACFQHLQDPVQIEEFVHWLYFDGEETEYIIVVGNPGAGKSTLLNSLMRTYVFESGCSLVDGLTRMCAFHECKGTIYVDTPGLADINFREQAAKEISSALSMKAKCKIIFVVALEGKHMRSEDRATLELIIGSLLESGTTDAELNFAVVVNKVQKGEIRLVPLEFVIELNGKEVKRKISIVNQVCVMEDVELEKDQKRMLDLPHDFEDFIKRLPSIGLKKKVDIKHDKYEQLIKKYQSEIKDLRQELEKQPMPKTNMIRKRAHRQTGGQLKTSQGQQFDDMSEVVEAKARCILCIGNAGVGTTTLIELMQKSIATCDEDKFEFFETEGLADTKSRTKAAESITSLLTKDRKYSIFFILALNSGRLRPEDKETMQLVLDAVPKIGDRYSVIINKMTEQELELLDSPENFQKLENELYSKFLTHKRQIHFIGKDIDGKPGLPSQLVVHRAPHVNILSACVGTIKSKTPEELREQRDNLEKDKLDLDHDYHKWKDYVERSQIRWLKVGYLMDLTRRGDWLPRCQDLPHDVFEIGSRGSFEDDCINISRWVISHPWRSARHPDPGGLQMQWVCEELDTYGARDDDLLFLDYTGLFQNNNFNKAFWELCCKRFEQRKNGVHEKDWISWPEPDAHPAVRTKQEEYIFREVQLKGLEILFSFRGMNVLIAPVPPFPDETKEMLEGDCPANHKLYKERGWCLFEFAVAHVFDVIVNGDCEDVQKFCDIEVSTSDQFREAFSGVSFSNESDKQTVIKMFERICEYSPKASKMLGSAYDELQISREESGTEYTITLDKTYGTRLGIDVDNLDGKTLLIESINGGLVGKWNETNPNEKVKVNDRIIEVNGIRDDLLKLVDECRKNQVLKLKLLRG